jgi:error-prone DNA polymerase
VVYVIVSQCFDLSKLLHHLVLRQQDDLPLLTLARGDEKSAPYAAVNKKAQVRQVAANDVFSKGRNFK